MKEIKEEKTHEVKETITYYEAIDGTRFHYQDECIKYENSARGILRAKLKKLEVWRGNEWDLLNGNDDCTVIALKLTSQKDVDVVMQAFLIDNPYYLKEDERAQQWLADRQAMADRALKEKDLLLMGLNCEDNLYFIDTRNALIERLNNVGKKQS